MCTVFREFPSLSLSAGGFPLPLSDLSDLSPLPLSDQMWLPPTPPAEEEDEIYVDPILSLTYHLSSTISPAVLAANVPFQ